MLSPTHHIVLGFLALAAVGLGAPAAEAQSRWPNTVQGAQQRAQDLREVIAWLDATIGQAERGEVLLTETWSRERNERVVVPVATETYGGILMMSVLTGELAETTAQWMMDVERRLSNDRTAAYRRQRADLAQRLQGMERSLAAPRAAPPPAYMPPSPGYTISAGPTGGAVACPTPSHWNISVTTAGGGGYHFKAVANGDGSVLMAYPSGDRMTHIEATGGVSGGQLNIQARDIYSGATSSTQIDLSPDCLTGTGSVRASRLPGGADYSGSAVASRYY